MYIYIQQKINKIMILLLFLIVSVLLGFYLLYINHIINMIVFILLVVIGIFMFNYFIRFMEQNLEHHTIYKMLKKKQIALAKIQNIEFYKELRDSTFHKQYVYRLHIQVKTLESKIIETDIYEKIRDSHIKCLPGDVYVSYDGNLKHTAIIPTLMIQMTPEIESLVRKFEDLYKIHYIVAIREKGLSLKSMSTVMKEMKGNNKD